MRQLKNSSGTVIDVHSHIITKGNLWEYFILEPSEGKDVCFALVMGFETEMGDVSMREIKRHMLTGTKDLSELLPAEGWQWVE